MTATETPTPSTGIIAIETTQMLSELDNPLSSPQMHAVSA